MKFILAEEKKKKPSLSYFSSLNPNAGDVEKSIGILNKGMGESNPDASMSPGLAEDLITDADFITVGDLISGLEGNMSDEDIDSDLRLFNKIARELKVKNADDVILVVDESGEYDPENYLTENNNQFLGNITKDETVRIYMIDNIKMIAENKGGGVFLYFVDDQNAANYVNYIKTLSNDYEPELEPELEEEIGYGYNRAQLVDAINDIGRKTFKEYNLKNKSDAQLYRMLNQLTKKFDKEQELARIEAEDTEVQNEKAKTANYETVETFAGKEIKIDDKGQFIVDGKSFEDIDDARNYVKEVFIDEQLLIERSLNELDRKTLDEGMFLDLRSLYEAVKPRLTPQDKDELRRVLQATNDPESVQAVLASKLDDDNMHEDLEEDELEIESEIDDED